MKKNLSVCARALRSLTILGLPDLPRAQDPTSARQQQGWIQLSTALSHLAQPWAPLIWAHLWAHILTWPWPGPGVPCSLHVWPQGAARPYDALTICTVTIINKDSFCCCCCCFSPNSSQGSIHSKLLSYCIIY